MYRSALLQLLLFFNPKSQQHFQAEAMCASCSSESNIAVVSHCGLLFYMLASFGHECGDSVQSYLHKGFDNCELRSMVLSDGSGAARPNPTWFSGGRMCLNGS